MKEKKAACARRKQEKGGADMSEKGGYEGKVSTTATQSIPALHPQKGSGDTKTIRGNDLRTGKNKK